MDLRFLNHVYYGNTLKAWLLAVLIVAAVMVIVRILRGLAIRRLQSVAERTPTQWDDLLVDLLGRVRVLVVFFVAVHAATLSLTLPDRAVHVIRSLAVVALLVQGALWGNRIISYWVTRFVYGRGEQDAAGRTTISTLSFIARAVLWTILFLLILDNFGVKIAGLITGLGIGGIAVALAAQELLKDLFASLAIVLDKPFLIGDFIIIDTYMGTVEHIGIKTTRIRSLSGEQLVFANSDILASRSRNYGRMMERRVVLNLGVTYQTPPEKLEAAARIVREVIEAQETVRFDRSHFKGFGDFALLVEAVYYILAPEYNTFMDRQQAINLEIARRFQAEGIEFAYPTQTLFMEGNLTTRRGPGRSGEPVESVEPLNVKKDRES